MEESVHESVSNEVYDQKSGPEAFWNQISVMIWQEWSKRETETRDHWHKKVEDQNRLVEKISELAIDDSVQPNRQTLGFSTSKIWLGN